MRKKQASPLHTRQLITAFRAESVGAQQRSRRRLGRMGLAAIVVGGLLLPLPRGDLLAAAPTSTEYQLGPLDKIKVKVLQWRASRDEVYEWTSLNSEFVVNASGRVALPLIGEIPATGLTTVSLARSIAEHMRSRLGLVEAPDATVEILQFRPFYATGHVEKPGEYPYRPGLTVLQAITIAGGQQRTPEQGLSRLEREAIATRGDLQLYSMEMTALLARGARLAAEVNGSARIEFPIALRERSVEAGVAAVMVQEEMIHRARLQAFDTQVSALEGLKAYLEQEVASLKGQLAAHDRQVASMRRDLEAVRTLVSKGLAITSRQNALERAEAQLIGERLRVDSNLMKAHQEISRCELSLLELRNKRSTELTAELRTANGRMDELAKRADTAERLLYETEVIAPIFVSDGTRQRAQAKYAIVRMQGNEAIEIAATEGTRIEPGDTIKVERPAIDMPAAGRLPDGEAPKVLSSVKMLSHQVTQSKERGN